MAKPKGINYKAKSRAHAIRLAKYIDKIQKVYDTLTREVARAVVRTPYDGSAPFHFSDYPQTKKAIQQVQSVFVKDMRALIYSGTSEEWKESNLVQDLLANKVLKFYGSKAGGKKHKVYYQTNNDALKAFQERKEKGLNLSSRLWNQSKEYKQEMEFAISSAIEKGTSAVTLSKRLSKYLTDFPTLKKDYKERYGKAVTCYDCEYRSIRLARSEINMAYRTAEQKRWSQFDFILGYEIKLSGSHPVEDICDTLKGRYPKDFVFVGWHPNCMCYCIPVLKTEEQFWGEEEVKPIDFKNMDNWMANEENTSRIVQADKAGTLPYWLKDNPTMKDCAILMNKAQQVGDTVQNIAESIAAEYGGRVTPLNYKSFSSLYRKVTNVNDPTPISDIKDAVRNTIVVDKSKIQDVLNRLKQEETFDRLKVQTPEKFSGYSGNIVNLRMPNGIKSEIQVNTPQMIYGKNKERSARLILGDDVWEKIHRETGMPGGLGHKYYEEIRVLDRVKDSAKIAELEKLSNEYYSHFR